MARLLLFMGLLASLVMGTLAEQGLSAGEQEFIVKSHNKERKRTRPEAANMRLMEWDSSVEEIARELVASCDFKSLPAERDIGANYFYRENTKPGEMTQDEFVRAAIRRWTNKKKRFTFTTDCGLACSYVKMVFAVTEKIGCAFNSCPSLSSSENRTPFLVCVYSTPQVNGYLPYQRGPLCSQCPQGWNCSDGLCFAGNDKSNGLSTVGLERNTIWQNQSPFQSQTYYQGQIQSLDESNRNGTRSLHQHAIQGHGQSVTLEEKISGSKNDLGGLKDSPIEAETFSSQMEPSVLVDVNNQPYSLGQPQLQNQPISAAQIGRQPQFYRQNQWDMHSQIPVMYQRNFETQPQEQFGSNFPSQLIRQHELNVANQFPALHQPYSFHQPLGAYQSNLQNSFARPHPANPQNPLLGTHQSSLQNQPAGPYQTGQQEETQRQQKPDLREILSDKKTSDLQNQQADPKQAPTTKTPMQESEKSNFQDRRSLPFQKRTALGQYPSRCQSDVQGQYPRSFQNPLLGQTPLTLQSQFAGMYPLPTRGHFKGPGQGQSMELYSMPVQGQFKGQYPLPDQGPFKGQYDPPVQGQFKGQYDIPIQGQFKGQYELPIQGQVKGQYDLPVQGQFKGQFDLPVQGQFKGQYDLPVQGQFKGQYDLPVQGQFKGQYDLPVQGQFKEQYLSPIQGQFKGQGSLHLQDQLKPLFHPTSQGQFNARQKAPSKCQFRELYQGRVQGLYPLSIQSRVQGQYPLSLPNSYQGWYPFVSQNQFGVPYPLAQPTPMIYYLPCQSSYLPNLIKQNSLVPVPNYPMQFPQVPPLNKRKAATPGKG